MEQNTTKRLHSAVWFTTMHCSMSCHYCWQVQSERRGDPLYKPTPWGKEAKPWIDAWNKLRPDILDITGGEPFMIPWLVEFIENLHPDIKLGLTTNINYDMTQFVQRVDPKRFVNITCSFHPTENGSERLPMNPELFEGRALMLKNRGFPITVNFVSWPEQLWLIPRFKKQFEESGLRFHVDSYSSISYYPFVFSEKEIAFVNKYLEAGRKPPELVQKYGNDYQVMCNAGLKHLSVQPNGDANRCILEHQMQINPCGNILDPNFELWDEERECNEHYRCPGCDRDKVKIKFTKTLDRNNLGGVPITIV